MGRGRHQNSERKKENKGHLLSREHRGKDELEHRKNPREQWALTSWRAQMDRQVRTQKESKQARGTHRLESTDGQTN